MPTKFYKNWKADFQSKIKPKITDLVSFWTSFPVPTRSSLTLVLVFSHKKHEILFHTTLKIWPNRKDGAYLFLRKLRLKSGTCASLGVGLSVQFKQIYKYTIWIGENDILLGFLFSWSFRIKCCCYFLFWIVSFKVPWNVWSSKLTYFPNNSLLGGCMMFNMKTLLTKPFSKLFEDEMLTFEEVKTNIISRKAIPEYLDEGLGRKQAFRLILFIVK